MGRYLVTWTGPCFGKRLDRPDLHKACRDLGAKGSLIISVKLSMLEQSLVSTCECNHMRGRRTGFSQV